MSAATFAELDVRIVQLPRMRVAAARATGTTPELEAWRRLRAWAEPQGLLADTASHPVFGFNEPGEGKVGGEYGYEFWIRVDDSVTPGSGIEIKEFEGGLFAVTKSKLTQVGDRWKDLWDWVRERGYRLRRTHELERVQGVEDEVALELYLPIQQ